MTSAGWGSVFENFGLKAVSRTDKEKQAYLPNEEQRAAMAAAGYSPSPGPSTELIEVEVLGEAHAPLATSYYKSLRLGSGREPETRMGRGLITWAEEGDQLVIGNIGNRVYVAKANKCTPEMAKSSIEHRITQAFKPRARLLQLLGDQLIGSSKLAVFELVKNAYDADASEVTITMGDLSTDEPWIRVQDNGLGMSIDTIRDVWLVPGDDHREKDRAGDRRSPRYRRLPLGEKGVGRFAVHKLGGKVRMTTRAAGHRECHVAINWSEFMSARFLEDAPVTVTEREAKVFTGNRTGTRIRIDDLSQKEWSRREVRDLYRQVTSISSPFAAKDDNFTIHFRVPGFENWISELPDASELVERAPWRFDFEFDGMTLDSTYSFRGVPGVRVEPRIVRQNEPLQITAEQEPDDLDAASGPRAKRLVSVVADQSTIKGIGRLKGTFYVFDRDREVISKYAQSRLIERFLDQNGGVRVYRDDIRIYNYGEPGDDWLGLDLRRVNSPSRNLSRNIVLGFIDLDLQASKDLKEKTNREGFVENDAYRHLRQLVLGAISVFETERRLDKQRIRALTGKAPSADRDVAGPISDVRKVARSKGFLPDIDPSLKRVEQEFYQLRDDFLRAGISQVGLAVVFHEVERGIGALATALADGANINDLRIQVGQLQGVLETSTQLLKKGDKKSYSLRQLARRARDITLVRFRIHKVQLVCPALEEGAEDASAVFAFGLALGAATNIIDNAIHWLKVSVPDNALPGARRIFMNVVPDYKGRPALVIADNGPGFRDPPEQLVEPFFSRRPDGMGLGLYYANLAMSLNDGELLFPTMDDFDIPDDFNGAVVALAFKGEK
ncbi:ATP-binding protein [Brucella intermedia GD04153]|uniref:ATP-binding protein n=1 Tax=Brucella intermedia GD04153 TaxID=2975438 RepID=A0AA42KMY1_9HYPH|nr:ATP-binding protein [Brucella intermedia]MDH0123866.1 ATP-binding protein [Brucella intermedia GD04153]